MNMNPRTYTVASVCAKTREQNGIEAESTMTNKMKEEMYFDVSSDDRRRPRFARLLNVRWTFSPKTAPGFSNLSQWILVNKWMKDLKSWALRRFPPRRNRSKLLRLAPYHPRGRG